MKQKKGRLILLLLLLVFIGLQFIPVTLPENSVDLSSDLLELEEVTGEVAHLLKAGCYDCHSNAVHYPWYSYVAPVSWLVARDVRVGKGELNFSDWAGMTPSKQIRMLSDVAEEVESEVMPLPIYPPLHPEARFTDAQRQQIINWANDLADSIAESGD